MHRGNRAKRYQKCQQKAGRVCTQPAACGTRGTARGKACERKAERDAAARSTWQGAEDCQRGAGERASTHVWGWEHNAAEHLLSLYITDLMAFNRRLCKRSGIGTKGAGGIIILTRGAKEHGKIACWAIMLIKGTQKNQDRNAKWYSLCCPNPLTASSLWLPPAVGRTALGESVWSKTSDGGGKEVCWLVSFVVGWSDTWPATLKMAALHQQPGGGPNAPTASGLAARIQMHCPGSRTADGS